MRTLLAVAAGVLMMLAPAQAACDLTAPSAAGAGPDCAGAWMDKNLHLNDIVTVGTHNSYKQAIPARMMSLIRMGSSKAAKELDYSHVPLAEQLDD